MKSKSSRPARNSPRRRKETEAAAKERRRQVRTASAVPLELYDAKGRMVVGDGTFLNLSTIGGQMQSPKPLKVRSAVRLRMAPAAKSALEILGRVVWVRQKGSVFTYGIRFSARKPS